MATLTKTRLPGGIVRCKLTMALSDITGLGASTTGEVAFTTIPQGATILEAYVLNGAGACTGLATLTASLGINGATTAIMTAETVFAANAIAIIGQTEAQAVYASAAARAVVIEFTGNANLSTATGIASGIFGYLTYIERQPV